MDPEWNLWLLASFISMLALSNTGDHSIVIHAINIYWESAMHCMMGARKLNMILLSNVGNTHSKVFSLIILWCRFIQGTKEHCGGSTASILMQANDSSHLRELSSKLSFFFPSLLWFFTVQSPHRCWNYPLKCKLFPVSPLFKILKRLSITDLRIKFSSLSRACYIWPLTISHTFCISIFCFVHWASQVAQWLRISLPVQEMWVLSLGWEDPLEKEMATHSCILAWEIPWTEEPGGLQSMGF